MDSDRDTTAVRRQALKSGWPWLLLGVWLLASAAQIWALEVESVQRGDACTARPASLWMGAAP